MSLGYWNFTEIITCLAPLNTQKDNPCWPATFFHNLHVNTHVEKNNQITPISVNFTQISSNFHVF